MKRFFDFKLYVEGLKKVKVAGICFLTLTCFLALLPPLTELFVRSVNDNYTDSISVLYLVLPFVLCVIFAPIAVISCFSFVFKRNESDFYFSAPFSRSTLFLSLFASCVSWTLGVFLLCALLSLSLWTLLPAFPTLLESFVLIIPSAFFSVLKLVGLTAVCLFISGEKRSFTLSFLGVLASLVTLSEILSQSAALLFPALDGFSGPASLLSVTVISPFSLSLNAAPSVTAWDIFYNLVFFVILTLVACYLFNIRKAEYAENPITRKSFRAFIRLCVSFPLALCAVFNLLVYLCGSIADEHLNWDRLTAIFPLAFLAIIFYVVCELVLTKSLKQSLRSLAGVPLLLFAVSCYATGMIIMQGAIISFMPKPENVESVCVTAESYGYFGYEADLVKDYFSNSPELISAVCESVCNTAQDIKAHNLQDKRSLSVTLSLKNGGTVTRRIVNQHSSDELITILLEKDRGFAEQVLVLDSSDFDPKRTGCSFLTYTVPLLDEDDVAIYNAFCEEYASASLEEKIEMKLLLLNKSEDASITLHPNYGDYSFSSASFAIPPSFTKTRLAIMKAFERKSDLNSTSVGYLRRLASDESSVKFDRSNIFVVSDEEYLYSLRYTAFSLTPELREMLLIIADDFLSGTEPSLEGSYISLRLNKKGETFFAVIPVSKETAEEAAGILSANLTEKGA